MTGVQTCAFRSMNDHLPKPIYPGQLYATLLKWLPQKGHKGVVSHNDAEKQIHDSVFAIPESLPGINLSVVLNRLFGNRALLAELITGFYEEHHHTVEDIRNSMEKGSLRHASSLVHNLKGVASNIGAEKLAETAGLLEGELRVNSIERIPLLLDLMAKEMGHLAEAADIISSLRKNFVASSAKYVLPVDSKQLSEDIDELARLLSRNSMAARKVFDAVRPGLTSSPLLALLEDSMQRLDFRKAAGILDTIRKKKTKETGS